MNHDASKKAVVIGAGFGGLAAALRLRAKGYQVSVLERQKQLGGKATKVVSGPFVYDAGPTVITARFLIDELFALFGRRSEDSIALMPVTPWYAFDFPSGKRFHYGPSYESTCEEISRLFPSDLDNYRRFYQYTQSLFDIGFDGYGTTPFDQFSTFLASAPQFLRLHAFKSCFHMVSRFFESPELCQAFSVPPLLVGGNPFQTPALYLLIHALENKWGVVFPKGGTGALVESLGALAREEGVALYLGEEVTKFVSSNRRITHVVTAKGESVPADLVVYNGDPMTFYTRLAPSQDLSWKTKGKMRRANPSMGLFVIYFSTSGRYEEIPHHLILFSGRFEDHIRQVFDLHKLPEDPNIYLHRPAATDPGAAPEAADSFYALVPVPNLTSPIDWKREGPVYAEKILARLESGTLPGLRKNLIDFNMTTPEDFAGRQGCFAGSAFTLQPTLTQSAYFRFANRLPEYANAFFVGAGTHPGAGVPGVLSSAKVLEAYL